MRFITTHRQFYLATKYLTLSLCPCASRLDTSRLEDRVGALMAELDQISKTETGSKQHATCRGTTTTTSAIDEEDEDQA